MSTRSTDTLCSIRNLAWVTVLSFVVSVMLVPLVDAAHAEAAEVEPTEQSAASEAEAKKKKKKKRKKKKKKKRKKRKKRKKKTKKKARQDAAPKVDAKSEQPQKEPNSSGGLILDLTDAPDAKPAASPKTQPAKAVSPKKERGLPALPKASSTTSVPKPEEPLLILDFSTEESSDSLTSGVSGGSRAALEDGLSKMSSGAFGEAALVFERLVEGADSLSLRSEAQYQLAKSFYKLGLFSQAFVSFREILSQGRRHPRFDRAIEWLFRLSRVSADQEPVLRELARFRNVQFPQDYRDEYYYLLAKHFFFEAQRLDADGPMSETSHGDSGASAGNDVLEFGAGKEQPELEMEFGDTPGAGEEVVFEFGDAGAESGDHELVFDNSASGGVAADVGMTETLGEAVAQSDWLISKIATDSRVYPKALYLRGLLHYLAGQAQEAVDSYRGLVGLLHPTTGTFSDIELRQLAFLALARIHYEHDQFDKSIYYYSRIPQGSEHWLTALFESSWAYFRRGDFDKALGRLLTLHSPFFVKEYFPESQIVKAIIYFEACRYEEARVIVDDFVARYNPMMVRVKELLAGRNQADAASGIYASLRESGEGDELEEVTARLLGLALADQRVNRSEEVLAEIVEELRIVEGLPQSFRDTTLGVRLLQELSERGSSKRRVAAGAMLVRFEEELANLKELLSQALKVKLEVARAEREGIEEQLRGKAGGLVFESTLRAGEADAEHVSWPYQGEYWRDELGTYVVDFNMCRRPEKGASQ